MATAVAPEPAIAPSPQPAVVDIAPLRRLLADLRRSTRWWIWVESLTLMCLAGAILFWGSLAVDWLLEPPPWWRMAVAVVAVAGLAWLVLAKLVGRLAVPLPDTALATIVERGHPAFRDSLSTAIELADRPRADVDSRLLARTAAEAAALVDQVDRTKLFRRRRLMGLVLAGLAGVASIAGLAVARPAIADLWVSRNVLFRDDPWPRQVALTAEGFVAGRRIVARGSDVDVIVKAAADRIIPDVVDLRSRGAGGWRTDRMGTRGGVVDGAQAFGHVLKNVTEDLTLEVRGGDARLRNLRLVAVDAPGLARLEIAYTLPEYLGGGRRQASASRIVQVPAGSVVDITCTATKPLSAATISAVVEGSEEAVGTLADARGGRTATASVGPVAGDRTLVVRFTDTDGLDNREPMSFVLSAVNDAPPQVAMRMPGISTAVTPRAVLPFVGSIADDHGLVSARVLLRVADAADVDSPVGRVQPGAAVVEFPPDAPERVALEPLGLAPGRGLTVTVVATDGCQLGGGSNVGTSDAWSLDVVTPEAMLAMLEAREIILRRRFESAVADLVQSRDRLAVPASAGAPADDTAGDDVARLLEATTRAAGETAEIAAAFRLIRDELANNALLSPELENRLVVQIADPLGRIAATDLPGVAAACRRRAPREEIVRDVDAVLARMRAVLDRMMELESFNEVVDLLRGLIRTQEEIRSETLRRQKQRAREALEQP
ncbi:MAG: hypothetical protein WCR51_10675 [Planctomycetia bacterium]